MKIVRRLALVAGGVILLLGIGVAALFALFDEKQLKALPVAQKLEADKQFFWLRPHCYQYVYQAVRNLAPEKLVLPVKRPAPPSQLKLFAA